MAAQAEDDRVERYASAFGHGVVQNDGAHMPAIMANGRFVKHLC